MPDGFVDLEYLETDTYSLCNSSLGAIHSGSQSNVDSEPAITITWSPILPWSQSQVTADGACFLRSRRCRPRFWLSSFLYHCPLVSGVLFAAVGQMIVFWWSATHEYLGPAWWQSNLPPYFTSQRLMRPLRIALNHGCHHKVADLLSALQALRVA